MPSTGPQPRTLLASATLALIDLMKMVERIEKRLAEIKGESGSQTEEEELLKIMQELVKLGSETATKCEELNRRKRRLETILEEDEDGQGGGGKVIDGQQMVVDGLDQ